MKIKICGLTRVEEAGYLIRNRKNEEEDTYGNHF